ncbi:ATP-binding protein [Methylolobus aquaticus]
MAESWIGLNRARLRWALGSFFLALALPTGILLRQTYKELQWESFHQHRVLAEELGARIDSRLRQLIVSEEARPKSDYGFLALGGDPSANFVVRSPLSGYPVRSAIPGVIGYFQIDDRGMLTTPLLPPTQANPVHFGIRAAELRARRELQTRIRDILTRGQTLAELGRRAALPFSPVLRYGAPVSVLPYGSPRPWPIEETPEIPGRPPWTNGPNEPWMSESRPNEAPATPAEGEARSADSDGRPAPASSKGRNPAPGNTRELPADDEPDLDGPAPGHPALRLQRLAEPVRRAPMDFDRLDTGHLVLSRTVWQQGHRAVQGALIEPERFMAVLIERDFRHTALSRMSALAVEYRGTVLLESSGASSSSDLADTGRWRGDTLYRTRLSPPLSDIELVFTIDDLPAGPGAAVVSWLGAILCVVLIGGCWLLYRLGLRQIAAAQQQQNFVAAVSHELKTPLTSIRMYGEMLREGWVSEERRASCYDFICTESERLTRLITNVLQLARVSRHGLEIELQPLTAARLLEVIRPRLAAQIQQAGFVLHVLCDEPAGQTTIRADEDCFAQIAINLVDNAIKFAAGTDVKRIELCCYRHGPEALVFSVRDFGPGVPKERMKKIFRLFYRGENESVRETAGTGIGLALVEQLATAMQARVDVVNHEPGAEFRVWFTPCDASVSETAAATVTGMPGANI